MLESLGESESRLWRRPSGQGCLHNYIVSLLWAWHSGLKMKLLRFILIYRSFHSVTFISILRRHVNSIIFDFSNIKISVSNQALIFAKYTSVTTKFLPLFTSPSRTPSSARERHSSSASKRYHSRWTLRCSSSTWPTRTRSRWASDPEWSRWDRTFICKLSLFSEKKNLYFKPNFRSSQYRQKDNIRFSRDRSKVHFSQQQLYVFDAESSYPLTENDPLMVLNMHMNVSDLT